MSDLRFSERITVSWPAHVPVAIDKASTRRCMTPSEFIRRCVIDRLEADGFDVTTGPEWAKVEAGEVVSTASAGSVVKEQPEGWLPIENVDSEAFDRSLHYRKGFHYVIEPTRVLRVHRIILKSEDR